MENRKIVLHYKNVAKRDADQALWMQGQEIAKAANPRTPPLTSSSESADQITLSFNLTGDPKALLEHLSQRSDITYKQAETADQYIIELTRTPEAA